MRYVGIVLIFLSIPVLIGWLRTYPAHRKWAYFAIGALPFTISWINLDASLINWPAWTGYAKGIVITLIDTLALAIILTSRTPWRGLPFLGLFLAYLFAVTLSIAFSNLPMSSSFYVFQIARVLLVFVAVASIMSDPKAIRWLAWGLAVGAIVQGIATVDQRLSGALQASGTMGHQNLLGLMLHFVTFPLLALSLAGEKSKIIILGVLASLIAVALGASRGAVGFAAMGLVGLFVLSMAKRMTAHKWKMVGLAVVSLAVIAPLTISTLDRRFGDQPIDTGPDGEREAFERAAKAMWADHPMGVGANQYVVTANSGGYSERAGVIWNYASRSAKVHNMYLLTAAETGWFGLITLASLIGWAIMRGLAFSFAHRRDPRGDLVLGAVVAIAVTAAHGFYEWVFLLYHAQYLFAISLGIIAGVIRLAKREKAHRAMMLIRQRSESKQASEKPPRLERETTGA
ncbi:MAG: O-antigen ligase family protein [Parasphingorhabdus sp.]|uniref:O-antigen ligase family protein n=1 Tax=Parasphingorhabdus sp. TaxID=2709688 RepID=UPI0030026887